MNQKGFTLLEAIVALVLIASTGMALLNWISTNLITLQHVQAAQQRNDATRNAVAFIETINPLEKPHGKEIIGAYELVWKSKEIELLGNTTMYQVGLYDMNVIVSLDKTLIAKFTVRQIGFKQYFKEEY
ncbi:MAG: prepilin-type N-terminal cleavage/methylation domain-containing protein [Proteobacteria bacterium]|nr:prepilin-type N-terminal cleavage/methylation domain-containing protein [Pseudomonadota bacterium]